jgi:uncharacterized membrane protein
MMTRQRYIKHLIGTALGMLTAILITPYLFGEAWSSLPSKVIAMFAGLAIYILLTWRTWTTNSDDGQE